MSEAGSKDAGARLLAAHVLTESIACAQGFAMADRAEGLEAGDERHDDQERKEV